jgi:hypothetical protein
VFVQVPGTVGRQYELTVPANDDSFLNVESEVDSSLWVSDAWVGFQFATDADRGKEAKYAGELAKRWTAGETVAVVGSTLLQGKPAVIATLYRTDGSVMRSAVVTTSEANDATLRSLARFVADGTPADGLQIVKGTVAKAPERPTSSSHAWWRDSRVVLALGAAALLASSAAYVASPADDHTQPTYDDRRTPAVGVFVGATVVAGAGVYLWLRDHESTKAITAATLGVGAAAVLAGSMLYATTEQPVTLGYQRPTLRDTRTVGLSAGAAGIAITGVGLWLWHRDAAERSTPVVSVDARGSLVGWSCSF